MDNKSRRPARTGGKFPGRPGTGGQRGARPGMQPNRAFRPEQMARSLDNPRRVALEVVNDVLRQDAYAALSLDERLNAARLNQLDRRLCASIVYRTLENLYSLDFALSAFLSDPEALDIRARNILRTAACQILLHDRVPDSAAVNEAVRLTREMRLEPYAGMVNAVLRRLADGKGAIAWPKPEEGARYLSVRFSLPEWLAQKLTDDYGEEEAARIAAYRTERHFITLRPTYGREAEFERCLARKVWTVEKGVIPGARRVYGATQIARDSDYLDGLFSIQSEGSMVAAEAVGARPGMQILDCCAAPGGKTAYMAERMEGTGRVYAWELHASRVALIHGMLRRLRLDNVRPAARDALQARAESFGTMDAVLLDAPCSGLGVMDDKPDVKYRLTREGLQSLVDTQRALLDVCCRYVRPGGTLVYSTCSLMKDEGERQIARFLAAHGEFALDALPSAIPGELRARQGDNGLQLLPCRDHIEGFFVARMVRKQ